MAADKDYIEQYRIQVQTRVWGDPYTRPRQRELEQLADQIEQRSGVRLSLSTLKRLWRDDVTQLPHPSTLNALVSVLDHATWADFKQATVRTPPRESTPATLQPTRRRATAWWWTAAASAALVTLLVLLQATNRTTDYPLTLPADIPFQADKTVTLGVPNTVQFRYDVSGIDADSFFIQQSWDPRDKEAIDPAGHYRSSVYYLPGFHRAKLIVNDSIVRKVRIHIKTDGWLPLAEYTDNSHEPFYLDKLIPASTGDLHITEAQLAAAGVDLSKRYQLRYYNIRDFDHIRSDSFTLQARVKLDSIQHIPCPKAHVTIVTEEDIFYLQLTTPGCVGDLYLGMGETRLRGQEHDLSALGCNLYDWQTFQIKNQGKHVAILLNHHPVYTLSYKKDFGRIVGIVFNFSNPGAIDDVSLRNGEGNVVYETAF
ncbi:hypothetical protein KK078_11435 [Fulvivirgaceae bacterium PWU37]|uniref:Uncharacterized protein n=2 Tax=Dawidia soli TaxID=2782352 RepID=A0AAP2DD41_9BACT|nr:hypothetical protein [Dawidia soli]